MTLISQRKIPDIDEALHAVSVVANDELKRIFKKSDKKHEPLSTADILRMKELTNLLLLVRKSAKPIHKDKLETSDAAPADNGELLG